MSTLVKERNVMATIERQKPDFKILSGYTEEEYKKMDDLYYEYLLEDTEAYKGIESYDCTGLLLRVYYDGKVIDRDRAHTIVNECFSRAVNAIDGRVI